MGNEEIMHSDCSWNTVAAVTKSGEIYIGATRPLSSPVCLGHITRAKVWPGSYTINNILSHKILEIACGPFHFCAITTEFQLITWGINVNILEDGNEVSGQLGHMEGVVSPPKLISAATWDNHRVLSASCGIAHTLVLTTGGIYSFGSNRYSQLARGSISVPTLIPNSYFVDPEGNQHKIIQVACGGNHCIAIALNGAVWGWGCNYFGQLGNDLSVIEKPYLLQSPSLSFVPIVSASCGANHTVLLSSSGQIFTVGSNLFGQLGVGSQISSTSTLQTVTLPHSNEIFRVSCGPQSTSCVTTDGNVYQWGGLRANNSDNLYTPTKVEAVYEQHLFATNVSEGAAHTTLESDKNISNLLKILATQGCRFESELNHEELLTAIKNVPKAREILFPRIQARALRWLHEKHTIRPYVVIEGSYILAEISDGRDLLDSMSMIANRKKTITFDCNSIHLVDIQNPLPQRLKVTLKYEKNETDDFTIQISPSKFILKPFEGSIKISKTVSIIVNYSEKSPPPQKTLLITALTEPADKEEPSTAKLIGSEKESSSKQKKSSKELSKSSNKESKSKLSKSNSKGEGVVAQAQAASTTDTVQPKKRSIISRQYIAIELSVKNTAEAEAVEENEITQKSRERYVSNLATYLPRILLEEFSQNSLSASTPPVKGDSSSAGKNKDDKIIIESQIIKEPKIQEFNAAILFVDISGFTSLNEKLAELGPAGPERVSQHINNYFTSLIAAVNEHGGDTLKFAGDALICMFGSPLCSESLVELTRRSVQCALDIQTRLAKYDSNQGFTLTLHVGIGAGKIYSLYVGGVDNSWEFLVTGEPLAQLRTCVDNSHAGEVAVSSRVWELVENYFDGNLIEGSDDYLVRSIKDQLPVVAAPSELLLSPDLESMARCFIPQAVQVQIDSGQMDCWTDELRSVTVLFVKLNSNISTESMSDFCLNLHELLVIMQTEVFQYQGMVRQFLADDKGTVLIAVFGVPPYSHTDGPLRGVRAAIAMHRKLKQYGMDNSIGVTTGQVFCGAVGSSSRREYAMVGDIVNLSARLMVAAYKTDAGVLCDKITATGCKGKEELTSLEPIFVKGKSIPIQIFTPSNLSQASASFSRQLSPLKPIIGRDKELELLKGNVDRVQSKEAPIVVTFLEGESGFGKSAICDYVNSYAISKNWVKFQSTCDSISARNPYSVWRPIIDEILSFHCHELTKEQVVAAGTLKLQRTQTFLYDTAVKICGPGEHADYISLLKTILPALKAPKEVEEQVSTLTSTQITLRITQVVTRLLEVKLKELGPILLIFEDIQWADASSLNLLFSICKKLNNLYVLASLRPLRGEDKVKDTIDKILTLEYSHKILLGALSDAQIIQLAKSRVGLKEDATLPSILTTQLVKCSQGNPMYCMEFVRHLSSSNSLRIENAELVIDIDLAKFKFPSFQQIIEGRFDLLSQNVQMVLKVASVIGSEFAIDVLLVIYNSSIGSISKASLLTYLENAKYAEFIRQDPSNPRIYIFTGAQFQMAAYSRLLFSQRTRLHKKTAEYYEEMLNSNMGNVDIRFFYPLLAHHWNCILDASIDDEQVDQDALRKTIHYLKLVGENASQFGENESVPAIKLAMSKADLFTDKEEGKKVKKELQLKAIGNVTPINLAALAKK